MAVSAGTSLALILLVVAALAAPGLLLLRWGLWPRRRGDEPRCRRCGYNLTGRVSERCPECGSDVTFARARVIGVRKRRPVLILLGGALLAISVLPMAPAVRQFNWYRLRPAAWVISDLDSPTLVGFNRAWRELQRRETAGTLSAGAQRKLLTRCLAEQGKPAGAALHPELIEYAAQALADGRMSLAEIDRFVDQVATLGLTVRERVVVGDPVPYWITGEQRCPCVGDLWLSLGHGEVIVDGEARPMGGSSGACGVSRGRTWGSSVKCDRPGRHTLELTMQIAIYRGKQWDRSADTLIGEKAATVRGEFEVLAEEPPDLVRAIDDPALTETLRESISLHDAKYREGSLQVMVDSQSPPVAIAFDVWVRTADGEKRLGSVARPAATVSGSHGFHLEDKVAAELVGETCTIIFRGSADAAKRTVDLYEYWAGELIYEDVPVEHETK